jgi:2-(1,2-epoxy-1,2-dihydrophenyl)acetyl-CoA isomerase
MQGHTYIEVEEQSVNLIRLNSPETRNAFTFEFINEMITILENFKDKNSNLPLIITGKGKSFSSGGNLSVMKEYIDKGQPELYIERIVPKVNKLIRLIFDYNGPTLTILNGSAVGGGLNLALACDFRLVEQNAKFRLGFTDIGLTPATSNTFFLPRIIGVPKIIQFSLFSEPITADQFVDLGIANELYFEKDFKKKLEEWKSKLIGLDPFQVKAIRKLMYSSFTNDLHTHLELEYEMILESGRRELFKKKVNERWNQINSKSKKF